ncbi:tetratricopeptide repeat protein [Arachidicoccus terrestris]|uniref:tetratricopeptide repeat protein n=1 Tax=Arachidicoccus terrestris TaxID=2875539 RepID=UPI001CC6D33C|nr:tetratricopeptide repeat protein [Arachidicoccus terrestris]UAY54895.1 tetratricopeptide repeat protein [Arachidicoccus terrestris]
MKKILPIIGLCLFTGFSAFAQKGNRDVYFGNKAYREGDLKTAVAKYEAALKANPENNAARVNLAIAQSKLKATDASVKNFDLALKENKSNAAMETRLNYDKGVTLAKDKKYQEAIDAFKKVLRNTPEDNDARENLQKALNELKKQQQQKKPQQNKDKKDQQKKQQEKQQQQKKQQQKQNQQQKMSKEQADKLLQALRNQEKDTRKKLQKKTNGAPPVNGEDW